MKSWKLISLLLPLFLTLSCKEQVGKKNILFLVPYEPTTQVYNSFIHTAEAEFSDSTLYSLHFQYVYEDNIYTYTRKAYEKDLGRQLRAAMRNVKARNFNPDLIITYGDASAMAAAQSDDPIFREKPVLCAAVVAPRWRDRLASMPNVVVMEARPEVKKNLDFIQELGFSNYVVTVMDSTYVDDRIREVIRGEIGGDREHYRTNLYLEEEDRILEPEKRDPRVTLIPVSTMWPGKNDRHPGTPGSFKFEWVFDTDRGQTSFLHIKNDAFADLAMSYNIGGFFTMTPEYFNIPLVSAMNYCLGGYFTPYHSMWEQLHPVVDRILSGENPSSIPWGVLEKDYWLDWRMVKGLHPYASDFPEDVRFVNLPPERSSRTYVVLKYITIIILVLVFLHVVIIIPLVMYLRHLRQRKLLYEKAMEAENLEKKVEYTLSRLNAYIWRTAPEGHILFSKSFFKDFGVEDTPGGIEAERVLRHVQEPSRTGLRKILSQEFDGEMELDLVLDMPDGSVRVVLLHTISLPADTSDSSGVQDFRPKAGFFYFNDEAYRRYQDLQQAYRRSEELKEKELFLSSVDNDFHKPLENLMFFSRLLADRFRDLSDQQIADCGENVMASNRRILKLLDHVVGDVKVSAGVASPELGMLNVAELMEEVYVNHSLNDGDEVWLKYVPGPADSVIVANRPVFIQVMNSLISNALSVSKGEIGIGWVENAGTEVAIFIANSGSGLSNWEETVRSIGGKIQFSSLSEAYNRIELVFPVGSPPPLPEGALEALDLPDFQMLRWRKNLAPNPSCEAVLP